MMQPSTKALAQMLAGNTKMSGQLVHARNVLAQANRMAEDRLPDRLPPAAREQFFEQLALLKLTIADAEEAAALSEPRAEPVARPAPSMDAERLREVALRLATAEPIPAVRLAPPRDEEADEPIEQPRAASGYALPRSVTEEQPATDVGASGPRRERLRLKPVQRNGSGSDA
jgi:hypothetical protein